MYHINKYTNKAGRVPLIAMFALFLTVPLGLSSCNTVEGVGEDIEATGQAVQNTGEKYNE